ncbi:VIER F-box protein 2 [Tanacetum coccineum]
MTNVVTVESVLQPSFLDIEALIKKTRKKNEILIGEAADVIGIPCMLIDIRHECSHRDLPSLRPVRLASTKAADNGRRKRVKCYVQGSRRRRWKKVIGTTSEVRIAKGYRVSKNDKVFNNEVNRLSGMDDDLFTYDVKIANIPYDSNMDDDSEHSNMDDDSEHEADDDMGYDQGDDEVELTDEESFDDKDEVAEVFRIDTNLFNFKTPMCEAFKEFNYLLQIDPDLLTKDIEGFKTYEDYKDDWIYEWNKDVPWVDEKPWTNAGIGQHVVGRMMDTVIEENLPGTYIIGNQLRYQDYEWYEALEDSELKDEALRNKAIMEGFINEDDDESRYEQKRQWNIYTNYDDAYEINHEDNEREELCEVHELPVCNIRRYMMIKYSFNNDEEYVAVKEDEYDDLTNTREKACRAYQKIFRIMDEGWMVTRAE